MTDHASEASGWSERATRDFDYGVGDELADALYRARLQIAAEIRRTAAAAELTADGRRAFEQAARLAENQTGSAVADHFARTRRHGHHLG